jgi:hypothetical protein
MFGAVLVAPDGASAGWGGYISGVSPTRGSTAGGTRVVVKGAGLSDALSVLFGSTPGTTLQVASDQVLTITSPAHTAGTVDVVIVFRDTRTSANPYDQFTYFTPGSPSAGGSGGGTPTPPPPALGTPPIDLNNPTATLGDPASAMSPVDTECHPGQVDINTAAPSELATLSYYVADTRSINAIIAGRPWLTGRDLASIQTIGTNEAAEIAPRTCTTQPVLPPPTPMACDPSKIQIDLQTASGDQMHRFGLSWGTVDQIMRARPLPQSLYQVRNAMIQYFTPDRIAATLRMGNVCITPAPMYAGGTAWRWATPAGGAVVARDGFSLVVPPGRITDTNGAYISVTPLRPVDGVLPRADAHIWGGWNVGETTVGVQGPWLGDPGSEPIVIHNADTGDRMSVGAGVAVSTVNGVPTVTSEQTSLSTDVYGVTQCSSDILKTLGVQNPLCGKDGRFLSDADIVQYWKDLAGTMGHGVGATISEQPSCGRIVGSKSVAASLGQVPFGITCSMSSPLGPNAFDQAEWQFTNNAHGDIKIPGTGVTLAHLGVLYNVNVSGGTSNPHATTPGGTDDLVRLLQENVDSYLFPSATLTVDKPMNSGDTFVDLSVGIAETAAWAGVMEILGGTLGLINQYLALAPNAVSAIKACAHLTEDKMLECVKSAVTTAADFMTSRCSTDSKGKLSCVGLTGGEAAFWTTAKSFFKWLSVGEWITNFGFALGSSFGAGHGVLLTNDAPPPPSFQPPPTPAPGGDGSYIARNPDPSSGRSVLVEPDGRILNIKDGGTFLCLAATRWVVDVTGQDPLTKPTDGDATCTSSGAPQWSFAPAGVGNGNIPDNVILREDVRGAPGTVQQTWLVNSSGELQSIPDGGTYLCLAYKKPVIWNVPLTAVEAWPADRIDATSATCS